MTAQQLAERRVTAIRACHHPGCIACRPVEDGGLGLRFTVDSEGAVCGEFACKPNYQGYTGRLHGGVIALLLDAAMTHCLFGHSVPAVTARLAIKYHDPVDIDCDAQIRAWIADSRHPLYILRSEVVQEGRTRASAEAKFICAEREFPAPRDDAQ